MQNKSILVIVLGFWFVIAAIYLSHTAYNDRQHDIEGHIQYVQTIIKEHRFPKTADTIESFQPPLYYLINSFIFPVSLSKEETDLLFNEKCPRALNKHLQSVQFASVFYGAITLVFIFWILSCITLNKTVQFLTLLFIASTPKFVYVFSTYNNDSLATLLSVAIIAVSYKLFLTWSWTLAIALLVLGVAGVYTKHTTVCCMIVICLICCKNLLKMKLPNISQKRIIAILTLSAILFSPWMIFHFYPNTGKIYKPGFSNSINKNFGPKEIIKTLRTVVKVPLIQRTPYEWDDPFAHPFPDHPSTKTSDHFAYSFVTSVIGEFTNTAPSENFIWLLLIIHLLACLITLKEIFRSTLTKLAVSLVFLSHSLQIAFLTTIMRNDLIGLQDYRYICWSWIAWAILYASALSNGKNLSKLLGIAMITGIIMNIYFLKTVTGSDI